MDLKGSHINHRLGWAQLDSYMNGSERSQSKKKERESNGVYGHRFKAVYLYDVTFTMPVGKREQLLTGYCSLQISCPPF